MAGTCLSTVVVLTGWDPLNQLIQFYVPQVLEYWCAKLFLIILRISWIQWVSLEASRTYLFICIPTMTVCSIYLRILAVFEKRVLNDRTLHLYRMLYCINQISVHIVATVAGTLMGFGFFIFVIGHWILLKCWNTIPLEVYLLATGIIIVTYFILLQTVPLAAKVNEKSTNIIQSWKQNENFYRKYWRRQVWATQPVAFHYAFTKFEKATTINYYCTIVNYTINVLLLY